jgi:hypothetical protein
MNELLSLIYFTFNQDEVKENLENAEADSFYCFSILMGEVKDGFIKSLDASESGIKRGIKKLNSLLRIVDPELWNHLENVGVDPQFYGLRWLLLLLTQEFELVDVLRIWDSLLCPENKLDFLYFLCVAITIILKPELMNEDFAVCLQRLQRIGSLSEKN